MTQITIDITNQTDTSWLVMLLEKLHLNYHISNDMTTNKDETALEKNKQIMLNYNGMSESKYPKP